MSREPDLTIRDENPKHGQALQLLHHAHSPERGDRPFSLTLFGWGAESSRRLSTDELVQLRNWCDRAIAKQTAKSEETAT